MVVTLREYGQQLARVAGQKLYDASKNLPDTLIKGGKSLDKEINNAGAEVACTKMLMESDATSRTVKNILNNWDPSNNVNTFGVVPDIGVGPGLDIRRVDLDWHKLRIQDWDHRERVFVRIIGEFPTYKFGGFVFGYEIPITAYRTQLGHPEAPWVCGVPSKALNHDFQKLIDIVNV